MTILLCDGTLFTLVSGLEICTDKREWNFLYLSRGEGVDCTGQWETLDDIPSVVKNMMRKDDGKEDYLECRRSTTFFITRGRGGGPRGENDSR